MKAVSDPPVGLVEHGGLFPYRPITRKRPMIESQVRRSHIDVTLVQYRTVARHKVLGALIADIVFRRLQVAPIGCSFRTTAIDRNQSMTDAAHPGLRQQLLNDPFGLLVFALAELMMPNMPLRIYKIESRPIVVSERAPYCLIAIDRDRKSILMALAAQRTLSTFCSNSNSGECTPITTNP